MNSPLPPICMAHTGPSVTPPSMNSPLPPVCMAHTGPSVTPPSMNSNTFTLPAHNSTPHVQTDNSTL